MIALILTASLLAPSDAAHEAIKAKDAALVEQFEDAIRVNLPSDKSFLKPIVAAIRYAENGGPGREYGILHPRVKPTYRSQAGWAVCTVRNHWDRYIKKGGDPKDMDAFIVDLGARYCPLDDPRDKDGLNKHWIPNVKKFYRRFK